ncbi:spore gernimation protein GerPD [Pueribacillus theae]|uniref:Spore gernimation protein GerPD n=1 Tax=Pueribacillus theae TaxID=2171751 RepID=A0A2U1JV66_9BACI|nr:spore gernimation protein GerPD [Pueribacillus theae]PWA09042.1 spore gernimation protein GerPD [Pueribacillus theae]
MNYQVINHELAVGMIRIIAVASSSIVLIGDTETISLSSVFDTPPESYIVGPQVSLVNR